MRDCSGRLRGTRQAAWVGWGFVAEQAAFADLCRKWIVFIGPDGDMMRV